MCDDNKNIGDSQGKSKKCVSECGEIKLINEFHKNKNSPDGHKNVCKACIKTIKRRFYLKNKENILKKISDWQASPHGKLCRSLSLQKRYENEEFKEKEHKRMREFKHNPEYKKKRNKQEKYRRENDIGYKILINLRNRITDVLKGEDKSLRTQELLGCSIDFFLNHIKSLFSTGMSFDKIGDGDDSIQIDHILPCELFDFSDPRQQKICFNYKNMQPLWATDNQDKSDFLKNGQRARNLTPQEKLNYLKELGFDID